MSLIKILTLEKPRIRILNKPNVKFLDSRESYHALKVKYHLGT
jgi:hypothetical protein